MAVLPINDALDQGFSLGFQPLPPRCCMNLLPQSVTGSGKPKDRTRDADNPRTARDAANPRTARDAENPRTACVCPCSCACTHHLHMHTCTHACGMCMGGDAANPRTATGCGYPKDRRDAEHPRTAGMQRTRGLPKPPGMQRTRGLPRGKALSLWQTLLTSSVDFSMGSRRRGACIDWGMHGSLP